MSMVFYYAPMSTAVTTHWALEELGVPYQAVKLDLAAQDQRKPEFLAVNPNGKVPALVHDGVALFESVAILIHLGETFGVERGLFPGPGLARAEAVKWLVWCNVSLVEALSRFQRNTSDRIPPEQRNAKAGEIGRSDVEAHLDILEAALKKRKFLAGDAFTLADLHVAGFVDYLAMLGFDVKSRPALAAWKATCTSRPHYARAMAP
jgi:glutathione S-transferase